MPNKITLIQVNAQKNPDYYLAKYKGEILGCVFFSHSMQKYLVESWGGNLTETVTVTSKSEAIQLLANSWSLEI